jgi:HPt (histidine-containing phosphotransfer) domain-containing protein
VELVAEAALQAADPVDSVPCAPAIDLAHLHRMTLGEPGLDREVRVLFERQADMLLERLHGAPPALIGASAHTLKGSARGVGAWQVARAAQSVEISATSPDVGHLNFAIARLQDAVKETKSAIAAALQSL